MKDSSRRGNDDSQNPRPSSHRYTRFVATVCSLFITSLLLSGCGRGGDGSPEASPETTQNVQELAQLVESVGGEVQINIDLSRSDVTDEDLARMKFPDTVRSISLHHTNITDKGVEELLRAKNLERVSLGITKITETSIPHLKAMPKLVNAELSAQGISSEAQMDMLRFLSARAKEFKKQKRAQQ